MKRAVVIISVLLFVSPVYADTIVQTVPFSGSPNFSQAATFNQFDDLGGTLTLQSIEVFFELSIEDGILVLDNDGELGASGPYEFGGTGSISSTDVPLIDAGFNPVVTDLGAYHTGTFNLDGNVGDGVGDFDPSAPDGIEIDFVSGVETISDAGLIAETAWGGGDVGYLGSGTFDILVDVSQFVNTGSVGGIEYAVTPGPGFGDLQVTYILSFLNRYL